MGSGIPASESRELPRFDCVELAGSNNVTIQVGGGQSVVVHADDNLVDRVTTHVSGGRLVIGNAGGNFTTQRPMLVEITVPAVNELALSGSGTIAAADVDATALAITLSGSGLVNASGSVDRLDVSLDGSADVQLQDLVARDVRAVVNGTGRVHVHATESLDASVPGSGAVMYTGNPAHVKQSVTGVGSVTPGQ